MSVAVALGITIAAHSNLSGSIVMFARVARVASLAAVRRTPSVALRALQTREKSSLASMLNVRRPFPLSSSFFKPCITSSDLAHV
jgi:hypothetical protein